MKLYSIINLSTPVPSVDSRLLVSDQWVDSKRCNEHDETLPPNLDIFQASPTDEADVVYKSWLSAIIRNHERNCLFIWSTIMGINIYMQMASNYSARNNHKYNN